MARRKVSTHRPGTTSPASPAQLCSSEARGARSRQAGLSACQGGAGQAFRHLRSSPMMGWKGCKTASLHRPHRWTRPTPTLPEVSLPAEGKSAGEQLCRHLAKQGLERLRLKLCCLQR